MTILYQHLQAMLLIRPPSPKTAEALRAVVARSGLRALRLPSVADGTRETSVTERMLTPTYLLARRWYDYELTL